MDGCMNGRMYEWTDGSVGEWIGRSMHACEQWMDIWLKIVWMLVGRRLFG